MKIYIYCFAANADPEVQFAVGQYYFLHQKYARALDYFERTASASRGNKTSSTGYQMQATYQLGVLYFDGLGVDYDAVGSIHSLMAHVLDALVFVCCCCCCCCCCLSRRKVLHSCYRLLSVMTRTLTTSYSVHSTTWEELILW